MPHSEKFLPELAVDNQPAYAPGPQTGQSINVVVTDLHARLARLEKVEDSLVVEMRKALVDRNKELEQQNSELQRALVDANSRIIELSELLLKSACKRDADG